MEEYRIKRRQYRILCENKKEEEKIRKIKTETEFFQEMEKRVISENGELTSVNEEEITLVELENQIKKLKKKKAAGKNKVKNKAWFYCKDNTQNTDY